jgi:hypothetical protein
MGEGRVRRLTPGREAAEAAQEAAAGETRFLTANGCGAIAWEWFWV